MGRWRNKTIAVPFLVIGSVGYNIQIKFLVLFVQIRLCISQVIIALQNITFSCILHTTAISYFYYTKKEPMQEAYIVSGFRTAVTKAKKGGFRFYRPDDLAVE